MAGLLEVVEGGAAADESLAAEGLLGVAFWKRCSISPMSSWTLSSCTSCQKVPLAYRINEPMNERLPLTQIWYLE